MEKPENYRSPRKGIRIGHNAKRIREAQELSVEYVASELGLDVGAYYQIEAEESEVNEDMLQQLSKALRVSIVELLTSQEQVHFLNYGTANEQSFSAHYHNIEIERLERLYRQQIDLLREEVNYLRNMLEAVAKKS